MVPWSTFLWELTTSTSSSIKLHLLSHTQSWISVLGMVRDVSLERWVGKPWGYDFRWSHGEDPTEAIIKVLWPKSTVCESLLMKTRASSHLHLITDTSKIKSVSAYTRYKHQHTRDLSSASTQHTSAYYSERERARICHLMRFNDVWRTNYW